MPKKTINGNFVSLTKLRNKDEILWNIGKK